MNIGWLKYADELGTGVQKRKEKKKRSKRGLHKEKAASKEAWQVSERKSRAGEEGESVEVNRWVLHAWCRDSNN